MSSALERHLLPRREFATAAALPPELFDNIIEYIGTDEEGFGWDASFAARDLKSGALVCIEWAQHCRRRLFADVHQVVLTSLHNLEALDAFTTNGSHRLAPLYTLSGSITVQQDWASYSWCHRPRTSIFYRTAVAADADFSLDVLILSGPVPAHLPRAAYHSPNWSLPRSLPSHFLPFTVLSLSNIHFPALSDLFTLRSHFTGLKVLYCTHATWGETDLSFTHPEANRHRRIRPSTALDDTKLVEASDCSDDTLLLALAFHSLFPSASSAFAFMHANERDACLAIYNGCTLSNGDQTDRLSAAPGELSRGFDTIDDGFFSNIPEINIDRPHTITYAYHADIVEQDSVRITCVLYCTAEPGLNGTLTSIHVVGLKLFLLDCGDRWFVKDSSRAVEVFRSQLAAFPHLQLAGVLAEPAAILQMIAEAQPASDRRSAWWALLPVGR